MSNIRLFTKCFFGGTLIAFSAAFLNVSTYNLNEDWSNYNLSICLSANIGLNIVWIWNVKLANGMNCWGRAGYIVGGVIAYYIAVRFGKYLRD